MNIDSQPRQTGGSSGLRRRSTSFKATDLSPRINLGPLITIFKPHVDVVRNLNKNTGRSLKALSEKHDFLIFQDGRPVDIGNNGLKTWRWSAYTARCAGLARRHPGSMFGSILAGRGGIDAPEATGGRGGSAPKRRAGRHTRTGRARAVPLLEVR
ncbi:hypothetical protein GGTG_10878 [Gaeumannomyces tritici R3-111a-1]|uniref:Uncharacterized protein n=1 Tax=Gaeumannomyces tritici (strain R3-111a-1) TaxID=644352 RepID=J3PBK6_GAET3|nr:hypothetical protein GGTG_10878 [Gaeumannomyces tritici R3-111a-1]EJT71623.1 hypothetical protein GGTG_10878 [Gaeumannomyces tritici R3-111a-1]